MESPSRLSAFIRSVIPAYPSACTCSEPGPSPSPSPSPTTGQPPAPPSPAPAPAPAGTFSFLGLSSLLDQLPSSLSHYVSSASASPSLSAPVPAAAQDEVTASALPAVPIITSSPPPPSHIVASPPASPPIYIKPITPLTAPITQNKLFRKEPNRSSLGSPSSTKSFGSKTRAVFSRLKRPSATRSESSISSISMSPSEKTFSSISSASSFATRSSSIKIKTSRRKSRPRHLSGLTLTCQLVLDLLPGQAVFALEYSPEPSKFIAAGGESGIIYLLDCSNRNEQIKLIGHTNTITSLSWSASGRYLLSASMDKTVRIWNIEKRLQVGCCVHADFVTTVMSDPQDEDLFLSGSIDRKLRLWRISLSKVIAWTELSDCITSLAISSTCAIAGLYSGAVTAFDPRTLKIKKHIVTKAGRKVTSLVPLSNKTENLLVATNDSRLRIIEAGEPTKELSGHRSEAAQLKVSMGVGLGDSGEDLIVSGSEDGKVYVWEVGQEHHSHESFRVLESGSVTCTAFRPSTNDSLELAVADDRTGLIRIYTVAWRSLRSSQ